MFGPGFAPTPPRRPHIATLITLRVVFVGLTVLSFGFLGWAAMLRIAVMRRRVVDWVLCCVAFGWELGLFIYIATSGNAEPTNGDIALLGVLVLSAIAITAYFLVFDIGHYSRAGRIPAVPYAPQSAQATPPPYGYGYQPPYAAPARPQPPVQAQVPVQPSPTPPRTAPRIDQVRAELDELSDILRQSQGGREGRDGR
ncbi:hypothetical protein KQY30_21925 [Streptomyces sp. GMY02]|uniref:hypothetical protein n=1 Tax=Streptomyces sp. GMY02 TaxID=1333528 RepID=UPI001C2C5EA7|nr:hypothetical protein [Streptomyces sp. GMY02]QXE36493.1 hypothetical protein KQY30_21925 [Streptomyces sp. GMY02]